MTFHDPSLIEILDSLDTNDFTGDLWRTSWKSRDPLLGGSSGGRWSISNGVEVLYTSLDRDVSLAELHHHLSLAPVFSSCNMLIYRLQAKRLKLLNLCSPTMLRTLNLGSQGNENEELKKSQEIGSAAHFLGYQGILVPSKRRDGDNCVLFPDLLDPNESLEVMAKYEINWPSWIRSQE